MDTAVQAAYSIPQFCQAHSISRALLYKLFEQGSGPRIMRVGARVLISAAAADEWRRKMEAATQGTPIDQFMTDLSVEELNLPTRAANCLKAESIHSIGDLIQRPEAELLRIRNLGVKSLFDIRIALESKGLALGTKLPKRRPRHHPDEKPAPTTP